MKTDANGVRELFFAALERDGVERAAWLKERCGDDATMRSQVEALLAEDAAAGSFMESPTEPVPPVVFSAGQRIDGYEIRRTIASGGMGTVYEAAQDHPHRLVALKVLRQGAASPQSLKRFQHEAEILGRLRHHNIAQVYEAGTFDRGEGTQPFFAMELVHGQPLSAHVQSGDLGTRDRLALFLKICDAVQYAHLKGVIHRDLKPDNILVNDLGEPKVLDFGIARATDSDIQATTLRTDIGVLIGTVPYMSPEQVGGDPQDLDTRSDVYSLGVVMYELLAGQLPHDLRGRTIPEAVRIIGEEDPTPLSSVDRSFRGDLETIVAKALEREKDRRYQTAADLAADVRHYLADEPVVARPATTFYQMCKFARRNKTLVGGIAASFALLLAGTAGIAWQWQSARREAAKATETNAFLMEMFALINPNEGLDLLTTPNPGGRIPTVGDLLESAGAKLANSFADWPVVRADLYARVGQTLWGLGRWQEAIDHLERAYTLHAAQFGEADERTLTTLLLKTLVESFSWATPASSVEQNLRRCVDGFGLAMGRNHEQTLVAEIWYANSLAMNNKPVDSLRTYRRVLQAARDNHSERDRVTVMAMLGVGFQLKNMGEYVKAESLLRKAYEIGQEEFSNDAGLQEIAVQLGFTLVKLHRDEEADEVLRQAHDMGRHDGRSGVTLHDIRATNGLAESRNLLGAVDEAERLLSEQVEACRTDLGDHPYTVWAVERLATFLIQKKKPSEAEDLLRDVLDHTTVSDEDLHVSIARTALARAQEAQDEDDAAEENYQKAVEGYRLHAGARGFLVNELWRLAKFLERRGKYADAEVIWREHNDVVGPESKKALPGVNSLIYCLKEQGTDRLPEAELLARQLVVDYERYHGPYHEGTLNARDTHGDILLSMGRAEEAEAHYRALWQTVQSETSEGHWLHALVKARLGQCLLALERYEDAIQLLIEAYPRLLEEWGSDDKDVQTLVQSIVDVYTALGQPDKEEQYRHLLVPTQPPVASD